MYLFHIFRSFVPLRNPLGFGVSDLLALGLALLALICIFGYAWAGNAIANFARRPVWCMLALFVLPIALRLALLPRAPVPVATSSAEFSSLLLSDTMLHARLANPPHPLHAFFDAPFVSQTPTYHSTLPIVNGVLPASGQLLFHSAWAGILLGIGALSAMVYWMLRAWITPGWALCGGALVACAFGPLSRWTNSYWGGFIPTIAGCMVLGALARLSRNRHARDVVLLPAGTIGLLASPSLFCLLLPILTLAFMFLLKRLKQFAPALLLSMVLMYGAHFLFWYGVHAFAAQPVVSALLPYEGQDFLDNRAAQMHRAVINELDRQPGKQVVLVRRGPWQSSGDWVHNDADIDASRIVWARDLGEVADRKLLEYYRNRKVWLLEPDAIPPRLRPYSASDGLLQNVQ